MKKLIHCLLITLSLLVTTGAAKAECGQEEAMNKMIALQPHGVKMQTELSAALQSGDTDKYNKLLERFREYSTAAGQGGQLLGQKKYDEACKLYDATAKKFGVDLKKSGTLTMQQLQANGGRTTPGGCDLSEAAKRMGAITQKFQVAFSAGNITAEQSQSFSDDTAPIGIMMSKDPSKACLMMDKLSGKYGLK